MSGFPSLTKVWHSKPYEAINPTRPELAVWGGKVIVITGGGGVIGRNAALAFAKAGCTKIAILGRRESPLQETKKLVESSVSGTEVLVVRADLASAKSTSDGISQVVSTFGKIDLLMANAAYLSAFAPVSETDPEDWWAGFEINTKGTFNLARAFLRNASAHAIVLHISTCIVHMPAMPTASSYVSSKLAAGKIWEMVAAENKNVELIHMHPGIVVSELHFKSGITDPTDEPELPAHFAVWAVSPEAKKFRGKYLWCNWDVPELLRRQDELSQPHQLTITLQGWPWGWTPPAADPSEASR